MDIELEDSAFGESLEQEQSYNPFQGIDGLEGCSLTGLGSALSRQKTLVVHSSQKLVLWRQLRGGSRMETIHTDIVERLYSGHLDTKPFLDPEPPVEVQVSLKQSHACGVFRRQQRDMVLLAHALSTGSKDLKRASVHIQQASEDLEEDPA